MKANERNTSGRAYGTMMLRLIGVLTFAVMLFGVAGIGAVSAQTFKNGTISVSQHEYVGICKDQGGTPSRAGPRQVKCDMGGGYSSTCNFKTMKCEDTIPMIVPDQRETPVVDNSGTFAVDPGTDTSQPIVIQPVVIAPATFAPSGGTDGSALAPLGQ
jgi:hypothetical protein